MATVENSEFDFSELDDMSDMELDILFSFMIQANTAFRESLSDEDLLASLDLEKVTHLKEQYLKICEVFIEWELVDYLEDPIFIYEFLENFSKDLK